MFDNFNAVISGLPLLGAMAFIVSVITEVIRKRNCSRRFRPTSW